MGALIDGKWHAGEVATVACPWASRTLILRAWKGLDSMIGLSITHWLMGDQGWTFEPGAGVVPDPIHHHQSHASINPSKIVPLGPLLDWIAPR